MTEYLDEQVREIAQSVMSGTTTAAGTRRELAVAAEANQLLVEYIDWLKDDLPTLDGPIVVDVGGTQIRFKNDEDFASWLSEMLT